MLELKNKSKKIIELINQASYPLLITHQRPDGDALGSITALMSYLEEKEKPYTAFCADPYSPYFYFLPLIEKITLDQKIFFKNEHDLVVFLDSPDFKHAGVDRFLEDFSNDIYFVNIDHHYSNEQFGNINLVMKEAASTTAILYQLFKENNLKINKYIATSLLTGLLTDTNNFSNPATNEEALMVASDLLKKGAEFAKITKNTRCNKDLPTLKIWGQVLTRLQKQKRWGTVTTVITSEDFIKTIPDGEPTEGIANFLSILKDSKVILVLKDEGEGWVKGSLRTNHDEVDVSLLASYLGGGGHKKAAGFTIPGRLIRTIEGWQMV